MKERLLALRREPLVHFLLGGAAIMLFFAWRGTEPDPASRTIVIDAPQVERLAARFSQSYRRAPLPDEIDGLIRDFVREEIYYREARRLGLDIDDTVVRQRLRQKMEYLARAGVEAEQPGDAALRRILRANPSRYAPDAVYSFDQVYLGQGDRATAQEKARSLLPRLRQTGDWREAGARLSVPPSMERTSRAEIERQFGADFAEGLARLASGRPGEWQGPVASGYGFHLVRLRDVQAPAPPRLEDVRQELENDWRAATVKAREAAAYQALLDGYTVRIEKP